MKRLLSLLVLLISISAFSQTVTLTFTGRDADNHYLPMNRVVIANVTQGWQETIYYPDTVFTMGGTGIADNAANGDFGFRQNNPNPFTGITYATLQTTDAGEAILEMTDVNGRIVETQNFASLQPGTHQFRINVAAAGIYFLTARQNGQTSSIKMVNNGQGATNRIEYQNFVDTRNNTKTNANNNAKGVATHPFSVGNDMIYTGYVTVNGTEYQSQMIHQNQFVSETFVLNFNASAPTGLPTVTTDAATNVLGHSATCGGNVTADGGYSVLARGVCWSTNPNPVFNDSHVSCGDGMGAFSGQLTGLEANTTYYVRAYAVNSVGTAYGNQVSFTTGVNPDGQPCPGTPTVTDVDNNTYNTVQIGNQCWMKENLKTMHYSSGIPISLVGISSPSTYEIAYCYFPNGQESNVSTYGYLYNWPAVMGNFTSSESNPSGVQGICPTGWHVPSDAEWRQLTDYVSSQNEYVCGSDSTYIAKALASPTGWRSTTEQCVPGNNPSSNNATGFSAVPAGHCGGLAYGDFGARTKFWSATQISNDEAYFCELCYLGEFVVRSGNLKEDYGYSVRCLRDEGGSSATLPAVTTTLVTSITQNSATSGGNVISNGGATVTIRGVCWSTSLNPTIADSHTTDGSGMGSFTSSMTSLTANTTYYVRAYVVNSAGTAYGSQKIFTTVDSSSFTCGTSRLTDYDNNTYNTVRIGSQCWMKENLRTTHYADGTFISLGSSMSTTTPYRYYPDNSSSNVSSYGYLYNWKAVMGNSSGSEANPSGVQGICPTGWHVPSDAEWTQLTDYVSSVSEYACGCFYPFIAKALASTTGWNSYSSTCAVGNNPSANNATGFSAVPAGYYSGSYNDFGSCTYFWSATQYNYTCYRYLRYDYANVYRDYHYKGLGYSVRCLRD